MLTSLLNNIYFHTLDEWIINNKFLIGYKTNTKSNIKKITTLYKTNQLKSKTLVRLQYIRYINYFLIGITGSNSQCKTIINKIKHFLKSIQLDLKKVTITNVRDSTLFLAHRIHMMKRFRQKIQKSKNNSINILLNKPIINAPINKIVNNLIKKKYAITNGKPTKNGKLVHLSLVTILKHYKNVERDILNYYRHCDNYKSLSARIHYILKYSCTLTIANKMKFKTLRKTFKKYGKNLSIKNDKNKIIQSYSKVKC